MADHVQGCPYHIEVCLSYQHRNSSPPKLPVGHRPITRAFQCVAVDLVKCECLSQGNRFIHSVIDHVARFVILIPIKNKAALTIVRHLIERVFPVFGPPKTLPTKVRNLGMSSSRNYSQFLDINKRVQPQSAPRATLFQSVFIPLPTIS